MIPTLFGPSESPLFGCFHAASRNARNVSVLVCPPVGQEYVRTHWVLHKLATTLERSGFDVLRFDYRGVGDSSKDSCFGSPDRWTEDIFTAVEELRHLSGRKAVSIIGLRLGALLSLEACSKGLVARDLILWDPVIFGAAFLEQMRQLHRLVLKDPLRWAPDPHIRLHRWWNLRKTKDVVGEDLLGFAWSSSCLAQIETLNALSKPQFETINRLVAFTSHTSGYEKLTQLRAASGPLRLTHVEDCSGWNELSDFEEALLADAIPQAILKHLMGGN